MYAPIMQFLLGISALTSFAIGIVLLVSPRSMSLDKAWRIVIPFFIFAFATALDVNSVDKWHPTFQSLVRWFVAPWILINTLYIVRELANVRAENATLKRQIREAGANSEPHEVPRFRTLKARDL